MTKVTTDDVVKAGYCVTGARRNWAAWGLTKTQFIRFVKFGLPEDELEDIDDMRITKTLAVAKEREASNG